MFEQLHLGTAPCWSIQLRALKLILIGLQAFDLAFERRSRHSQLPGRARRTRDPAPALLESRFNHAPFLTNKRRRDSNKRLGCPSSFPATALVDREDFAIAKDHGPLHDILQLANVA